MTPKARLRNKADRLAKQRAFEKYGEVCELCGSDYRATAHHYFYRSSYGHLRFDLDNLVILCGRCHSALHFSDPKKVEDKIIEKAKGEYQSQSISRSNDPRVQIMEEEVMIPLELREEDEKKSE